jgi:hypothetical protein
MSARMLFTLVVGLALIQAMLSAHAQDKFGRPLSETGPLNAGPLAAPNLLHLHPAWTLAPPEVRTGESKPVRTDRLSTRTRVLSGGTSGRLYLSFAMQKTESEAQKALQGWLNRYPDVFKDRQFRLEISEHGDKGVGYAMTIEPFDTTEQSLDMCSKLQTAGGMCIIVDPD